MAFFINWCYMNYVYVCTYTFLNIMDSFTFKFRYAFAFRPMVALIRIPRFGAVVLLTGWVRKEGGSLRYLFTYTGLFDLRMP